MKHLSAALTAGALMLLSLIAAQPLLYGRLPWAADTLLHLYRLVELDHLLRQGYLFPRYAPDLAYGFGFPLFNFYAPLSYYAAMIFRLIGMDFALALLATFGVFILCAALGMYAWATEVWGQRAGLVAAAAYVTSPYLLYNVYHRGALAEVLAMALMPALLWAITRWAHRVHSPSLLAFILTALFYAALLLGHNITALIFTPVVLAYAITQLTEYAVHHTQADRVLSIPYCVLRVALPLGLGLGLAAFFWLPAFVERDSVQIIQLFMPQAFDYHYHFVELFSLPMTVDPNLVLPPTPRGVGLIPLTLAVAALALKWKRWNPRQKVTAGLTALLALGSWMLTLPQSVAIWDALPLLRFVQFPWRFLGLTSLSLAFLTGGWVAEHDQARLSFVLRPAKRFFVLSGISHLWVTLSLRGREAPEAISGDKNEIASPHLPPPGGSAARNDRLQGFTHTRREIPILSLIVAALILYGFAWQFVPYLEPITHPTVADIARYERESGALGTTSAGDYLPNTVKKLPDPNTLSDRYARSDVIERLDPALPPDAQVIESHYRPLSADVILDSATPFTVTFDIFDFAGWQARVDGQPIAITPTDPHGLISFPVPAGRHRLQVAFGSTPLRTVASLVSLLSALALVGMVALRLVSRASRPAPGDLFCDLRLASWVCVFAIGLLALKTFYLDTHETIWRRTRFDGLRVAGVAHPLNVNFDHRMALMGYDPARLVTEMGRPVRVTLYWRAMQKLDTDYSISAQLVDERGLVYGQRDSQHPGGYPTSRWKPSDYARDVHDISLAPGTPPGEYRLRVGVYRVGTPGGLSVLDSSGAPSGITFDMATVSVRRPGAWAWLEPHPDLPRPEHLSDATLAPGLVLMGYDWPQAQADAGAKLFFTLYWRATAAQTHNYQARLQLADLGGAVVFSSDVAPISSQFSTRQVLSGDVLRGPNSIRIPAAMPGGTFALRLSLVDETGAVAGGTVELGHVTIRVPQRTMTPPRVEHPVQVDFGGQARWVGYDIKSQIANHKSQIKVVLYWQALQEMTADYKSFVHLLDPTGRLVVTSDAIPANWTRPTTGWLAGEYVIDPHTLTLPGNLPPGEYRLEVGLYEAETNARLGNSILWEQPIVLP